MELYRHFTDMPAEPAELPAANGAATLSLMPGTAVQTVIHGEEQGLALLPDDGEAEIGLDVLPGVTDEAPETAPRTAQASTLDNAAAVSAEDEAAVAQTQTGQTAGNARPDTVETPEAAIRQDAPAAVFETVIPQTTFAMAAHQTAAAHAPDVISQIVSRFSLTSAEQFTEIKMTLRPANLGDVSLKIATVNGLVTAQFVAENQRVREIIETNFNQLRDALQRQGVSVSELSVSVQQDQNAEQMNQFLRAQQGSRQRMANVLQSIADDDGHEAAQQPREEYNTTVSYLI
jgi:flagellar hook-length control protein FliK